MKDIKVQYPNGDVITVSEKAFNVIYKPLYGCKEYKNTEQEIKPKKTRKVKKVEKNDSKLYEETSSNQK